MFGHEQTLRKSVEDTFTEGKRRASLLPVRSHQPSVVLTSEDPAAQMDTELKLPVVCQCLLGKVKETKNLGYCLKTEGDSQL